MQIQIQLYLQVSPEAVEKLQEITGYKKTQIRNELSLRYHRMLQGIMEENSRVSPEFYPESKSLEFPEGRWALYPVAENEEEFPGETVVKINN
jgi:hypothetical protein